MNVACELRVGLRRDHMSESAGRDGVDGSRLLSVLENSGVMVDVCLSIPRCITSNYMLCA